MCAYVRTRTRAPLGQPGLSSRDNQSWALVRQPSEAERGKAGADVGALCVLWCASACAAKGNTALVVWLASERRVFSACVLMRRCVHMRAAISPPHLAPADSLARPGMEGGGRWRIERDGDGGDRGIGGVRWEGRRGV